jgi:glycosyltransferase involved in cell wall biosynthesis
MVSSLDACSLERAGCPIQRQQGADQQTMRVREMTEPATVSREAKLQVQNGQCSYVLITPARNEAAFIELTIKSVIRQTVLPLKWVIVSDGSTDSTDAVVEKYTALHKWMELLRMPKREGRNFAGKVFAFNAGYDRIRHLPYRFLGCMDADITFEPDYFAYLLDKAGSDLKLGIVGTAFREGRMSYDYRFVSVEHVSGPCQLFRRECFEDIGGYVPASGGGVDHIAVLTARMKGWKTRTFTEKQYQHRDMGSAKHGPLGYKFAVGRLDYALGGHPLWELFRVVYQMTRQPWILGGIMIAAGYLTAALKGAKRPISLELVRFRRQEQMARLKRLFGQPIAFTKGRSIGVEGELAGSPTKGFSEQRVIYEHKKQ